MLGADEIFCLDCDANYTTLCAVPSHSVMFDFLQRYGLQPSRLLCPWGFSKQKYCSELPCTSPGDLLYPGIKPTSLMSFALAEGFFTTSTLSDH